MIQNESGTIACPKCKGIKPFSRQWLNFIYTCTDCWSQFTVDEVDGKFVLTEVTYATNVSAEIARLKTTIREISAVVEDRLDAAHQRQVLPDSAFIEIRNLCKASEG